MTHNIIKTDNYLLIVSDEEIKVNDWFYLNDANIIAEYISVKPVNEAKKIIAHLPLNNSPVLEGVSLLPPLEDEQSLQQPKMPVAFECEVERIYPNPQTISKEYDFDDILIERKTTTNSQGQTVLVGKYIY